MEPWNGSGSTAKRMGYGMKDSTQSSLLERLKEDRIKTDKEILDLSRQVRASAVNSVKRQLDGLGSDISQLVKNELITISSDIRPRLWKSRALIAGVFLVGLTLGGLSLVGWLWLTDRCQLTEEGILWCMMVGG